MFNRVFRVALLVQIGGGTVARKPLYTEQRVLLTELADPVLANPSALDPGFAGDWDDAADDAARKRVIVDQVASLTDQSATR